MQVFSPKEIQGANLENQLSGWESERPKGWVFPQNPLLYLYPETKIVYSKIHPQIPIDLSTNRGLLPLTSGPWTTPLTPSLFWPKPSQVFFPGIFTKFQAKLPRTISDGICYLIKNKSMSRIHQSPWSSSFLKITTRWKKFNQIPSNKTITYPTKGKNQENVIDSKAPSRKGICDSSQEGTPLKTNGALEHFQ